MSLNFVLSSIGWGDCLSFGCGWIFIAAIMMAGVLERWVNAFEISERTFIPCMLLAAFANATFWFFAAAGIASV